MTLVNLYTSDRKMTLSAKGIWKFERKKTQKNWRFVIYAVNKRTVSDMIFKKKIRIMFIPLPA